MFSTTFVNITTPSATPFSTNSHPTGGLTLGAKVGIAVSVILVFLGTTGFCIVWNGRRRRRKALAKHQQETGYATWLAEQQAIDRDPAPDMSKLGNISAGGFHDSPQSQQPLFPGPTWGTPAREDESPASVMGERVYLSPYSSQYSSPVSAHDQVQAVGREWPVDQKGSIGGSSHGIGRSRSTEKRELKDADRIELQNVAPVLLHPGNGRSGNGGLGEDDMRRGLAL